jgi:histidinol-phosphate phosphatase family protein
MGWGGRFVSRPAVFLDRDGVINRNRHDYVKSVEEFEFLHGVPEAVCRLSRGGYAVVIVTNQSAVGRGLLGFSEVRAIHDLMLEGLSAAGGAVEEVRFCPHTPDDGCHCRKPRPGMLLDAALEYDLDLRRSFLVGDAASDIEAASEAGCRAVLVETGRGREQRLELERRGRTGFHVARDLTAAADWILSRFSRSVAG